MHAGFVRDGRPVRMGLCCAICDDAVLAFPIVALHNPANQATEGVAVLPCGHFYGAACVSKWLATQHRARRAPTCPDCRHPLVHPACGHGVRLLSSPFTPLRPRGAREEQGAVMLSLPTHLPPALLRMIDNKYNSNNNGNTNNSNGHVEEDEYCPSCRSKQASARGAAILRDRIRMATARASGRRVGVNNSNNGSNSNNTNNNNTNNNSSNNNDNQNSVTNRRRVVPTQPINFRTPASREQQQAIQRALRGRLHLYAQTSTQQRRMLAYLVHRYLTEPANSARFLELIGRWPLVQQQQQEQQPGSQQGRQAS
ncbi:hypothetical protein SLS62_006663 [Diatrype stigma]|uniref:RING-type domain-containing protein n=1 Tax=Diatrype stigma TaxID=117547 RepID=A0AAN9UR30_9PEZI